MLTEALKQMQVKITSKTKSHTCNKKLLKWSNSAHYFRALIALKNVAPVFNFDRADKKNFWLRRLPVLLLLLLLLQF